MIRMRKPHGSLVLIAVCLFLGFYWLAQRQAKNAPKSPAKPTRREENVQRKLRDGEQQADQNREERRKLERDFPPVFTGEE